MKGGFRESPLRLNEGLGRLDKWDGQTILNRAQARKQGSNGMERSVAEQGERPAAHISYADLCRRGNEKLHD